MLWFPIGFGAVAVSWLSDGRVAEAGIGLIVTILVYFGTKIKRIGEHVEVTKEQVTNNHTVNFRDEMTALSDSVRRDMEEIRRETARRDALADERMNCLMSQVHEINHRLNDLIERG